MGDGFTAHSTYAQQTFSDPCVLLHRLSSAEIIPMILMRRLSELSANQIRSHLVPVYDCHSYIDVILHPDFVIVHRLERLHVVKLVT